MRDLLAVLLCLAGVVSARELFVAADAPPDGEGSRVAPLDLRSAIASLEPGDTLTLLPGEYCPGEIRIGVKGTAELPVVIQGADRDLTVLSAWAGRELDWSPAPGKRFVYESPCESGVVGVTDVEGGMILQPAPELHDMDRFRGTWLYDSGAGMLYVHALDGKYPSSAGIKTTVHSGNIFNFYGAEHVTIRNMSFYGSAHEDTSLSARASAVRISACSNMVVEDCSFLYNSGGVNTDSGSRHTIVRNSYFMRNESFGYSEMAQLFFGGSSKDCLAEGNVILHGRTHGLRFYSGAEDVAARGNVIVGERMGLYFKASREPRLAESNVVVMCDSFNFSDLVGRPTVARFNTCAIPSSFEKRAPDNLLFDESRDAPRFCAPEHHDYRLQSDSAYLGRGAYPEPEPVFYVSPDGSDDNEGRCEREAFGTLRGALRRLPAGAVSTIYLQPGDYDEEVELHTGVSGLVIRGRGENPAVGLRRLSLSGASEIRVENLRVGELELTNARDVFLERVVAGALSARDGARIRIRRCEIAEAALERLSDSAVVFSVLPRGFEGKDCDNLLTGYNSAAPVFCAGAQGEITGAYGRVEEKTAPVVEDVELLAVYPSTAAFGWSTPGINMDQVRVRDAWWTLRPIVSYLEYGETEECKERVPSIGETFHHVRVQGLKPGVRYYYRVVVPEALGGLAADGLIREFPRGAILQPWRGTARSATGSFTTPRAAALSPRELHVATNAAAGGDGGAAAPFRYIDEAACAARPGDTIIVHPGVYRESFEPRVSGLPGSPITIRAAETGTVILDGSHYLRPGAVHIENCDYIVVQGLIFRDFSNKCYASRAGMEYGQVQLIGSRNIVLRDNVFSGYGVYQYLVSLKNSADIAITNNVFASGVNSISGAHNGNLTIEGNTFYAPLIYHFTLSGTMAGSRYRVRKNLFLFQSEQKSRAGVKRCEISGDAELVFDENAWYFSPEDPVRFCGMEGTLFPEGGSSKGLERLRENTPHERNGVELASFELKNTRLIDTFPTARYRELVANPVAEGRLVLTLDYFEPAVDMGYGASPKRAIRSKK